MGINREAGKRASKGLQYLPDFSKPELLSLCKSLNINLGLGKHWRDIESEELQRLIRQQVSGGYFADSLNRFADQVEDFRGALK